ncbi:hypothetical protein [Dinghuibacter silviterrae]|uniref:Uncharacterized protein n=1 Tax=Dinghuibacter silviterrae TaxID=1539049 RepID=A0A4R8DIB3_9BACT|nr:hypothetical protein [Dinghuibacter silviterrae]TDW97473.1 hypothetical protein EDB95_5323 [Dinghuibacter silviterrae]
MQKWALTLFFIGTYTFLLGQTPEQLILFGRGTYPGDDSTVTLIRNSGFTTLMLSSFYIHANGDVFSGDDGQHPIIHNGQYTGSKEWLDRIAAVKKGGSIKRVEILLEGRWFNQAPNTYDFIKDWIDSGKTGTLYAIARIMKKTIGADALCIDDESVYDSHSIIRFGEILHGLGLHMTLCPYTRIPFWKTILDSSRKGLVDAVYLQCYDGGGDNTLGPWVRGMGGQVPVYPVFLCRGSFGTCSVTHNSKSPEEIRTSMQEFARECPGLHGAGIWQLADIKDYIRMNCAVKEPASGSATSVSQYLEQLRASLQP